MPEPTSSTKLITPHVHVATTKQKIYQVVSQPKFSGSSTGNYYMFQKVHLLVNC